MDSTSARNLIGTDAPDTAGLPTCRDEVVIGYGLVTVITGFLPGTDRLLLDFNAGAPLPAVTLNLAIEPGSTAVMGNGLLMVMLRGATGVATSDVELRELPRPEDWDREPEVETVDRFDPNLDVIEILCDPDQLDLRRVAVVDFSDGTGATVLFNDRPVLKVRGAQGLDPQDILLVPRRSKKSRPPPPETA